MTGFFGGRDEQRRPKMCPACGMLVGAVATKCPQCGASVNYSLAAAGRSLGRLLPTASPATYGILSLSCLLYVASLLATVRESGLVAPGGGLSSLLDIGGINGDVLQRLGASFPLFLNLMQPWRFVTAVFLHASIVHIGFNMWALISIGPQVEEQYGSARYLFIYVATGIVGFVLSSTLGQHMSVGGSGALLGLIGVLLANTMGRQSAGMQMLRSQLVRWLISIALWGFLFPGIDNYAHIGGFACGFVLGKIMADRQPSSPEERNLAYALGWGAALTVVASFALMAYTGMQAR